uniref:Probable chitinase 3 n=1 Tax=Zeugodacus cucurbitae TaxID=28588 RepID=A0A0A1X310_ZEUCU
MFRLHKYFTCKLAIFAVITVQLLVLMQAREISQCESQTGYIPNMDPICQTTYSQVYCDGADSAYCTESNCLDEYECTTTQNTAATKPPTKIPAPAPPVTTTLIPPTTASTTIRTAVVRENCRVNKNLIEPYPGSCRYYYHCVNGYFGIGDCGNYMFFDAISKKCTNRKPTSCQ